jgi:hypothetical protein
MHLRSSPMARTRLVERVLAGSGNRVSWLFAEEDLVDRRVDEFQILLLGGFLVEKFGTFSLQFAKVVVIGLIAGIYAVAYVWVRNPEMRPSLIIKILDLERCKAAQSLTEILGVGGFGAKAGLSKERIELLSALCAGRGASDRS